MTLTGSSLIDVALAQDILAHGVGGRSDLPLPFGFVVRGAAVALLASFLGLGMLWRTPRLRAGQGGLAVPRVVQSFLDGRPLRLVLQLCGVAVCGYVAVAAVFGPDDALNPAPHAVYVLFWVGMVPASLLFGPVWRYLNPLRSLHTVLAAILRVDRQSGLREIPSRLGYWPAAVSLLSFVWLELAAPGGSTTHVLRLYFGIYGAVHVSAALVFGSRWFGGCDGFEVYSTMVARLCPLGRRDDGRIVLRNPLDGAAGLSSAPGIVAVVAVLLGSTGFDSLSGSLAWVRFTQSLGIAPVPLATAGLLAVIALVAGTYTAATILAGGLAGRGPAMSTGALASHARVHVPGAFAHSIVPIIVGYVIAHYFSYLIFQGQQALILLSDPLGTGANLLGTATRGVDYTLVAPGVISVVQVLAVVGGHVLGVVSAHDRAVALFPRRKALAGQLPLLVLMIGYTSGGLLLLFAA